MCGAFAASPIVRNRIFPIGFGQFPRMQIPVAVRIE